MVPDLPAPPRWLLVLAALVLGAGLVASFVGAFHIGVSWDETYHVQRLRNFLDRGWYLIDTEMDGFQPASWNTSTYVYGPVAALTLHWVNVLLGGETAGHVDATSYAFTVRHVGVAVYGLVGVLSTMGIARIVFRSWGWAVVTGAALVTMPTWTGHSMFNIKDIPVAAGCTMVTLGVALVVVDRLLPLAFGLMLLGCVVAIGTRPGIWTEIALVFLVGLVGAWRTPGRIALMVLAGLASFGVLALIYPHAFSNPVSWMWHSATQSADFQGKPGKRWYLPLYLLIELPNLVFGLFVVGSVLLIRRFRDVLHEERPIRLVLLLAFMQTVPLPVIAVINASNVYTGLRQFLFCAPGVALVVTVAIGWLCSSVRPRRLVARAVAGLTLVVPMVAQLALFPFDYAYASFTATALEPLAAHVDHRLQIRTDYWRTSVRELAPSVPAGGFVVCTPLRRDGLFVRRAKETSDDCASDGIGPLQPYNNQRGPRFDLPPTKFYAVDTGHERVGANCTVLNTVTRRLYWRKITLSTASRCSFLPATYPTGGVAFTADGGGKSYALSGWLARPSTTGLQLTGSEGLVAFTLPPALRGHNLVITGDLKRPESGPLSVTVNGSILPITGATSFRIDVPEAVASSYTAGRLLIDFTGAGLRLYDIAITAQ